MAHTVMTSHIHLLPPDARGEIHQADIHGTKFNTLYTRAGYARSGDVHEVPQHDLILSGKWKITMLRSDGEETGLYGAHSYLIIPPNVPHLFECLEDSVMIEWWDGDVTHTYYRPYRDIVDRINRERKP